MPRFPSVGHVARRSGVAVSPLRLYDGEGLIASQRSDGNQRANGRGELRRILSSRSKARR
ncbi:hypothetical protein GCM10011415_29400 [Salipiger pallidus]|uniref:HTH merR-type domain-containing protein n=1 Tax=Salipiger pallidus TaxID=1775170 RepID=A0A8J2ZLV1_9RHOB|nr:hypothetical protein GCM10011415_29400 [Salipiger pallidus]